ncbi:GNAT family N-acetyltransferase [Flavobacteriales bacterium]|nr:GNAT family N-acetyltransferase [Flavobacteriales bacterium]
MQTSIKKWDDLSKEEVEKIFSLRSEVFIVEQECPYQDVDGKDAEADHLLLYENNILCGYTRIFPKNTYFKEASFGRTVVKKTHRGKGYGHALVKESLKYLKKKNEDTIKISAQSYLTEFYASHGFVSKGEEYLEDNIPHTAMFFE